MNIDVLRLTITEKDSIRFQAGGSRGFGMMTDSAFDRAIEETEKKVHHKIQEKAEEKPILFVPEWWLKFELPPLPKCPGELDKDSFYRGSMQTQQDLIKSIMSEMEVVR